MTLLSWLYMGLVWAGIIALNAFCFYRIFGRNNTNDGAEEKKTQKDPALH